MEKIKTLKEFEIELVNLPLVALIIGKRGSGKTCLGFKLLEDIHEKSKRKIYALGSDLILPDWIELITNISQAEPDSIILVDEANLHFEARRFMQQKNIFISHLIQKIRHNNQTLIFICQYSSTLDLNIIRQVDVLLLKEPSIMQRYFERSIIKTIYQDIAPLFNNEFNQPFTYVWSDKLQDLIQTGLPSFWSDKISCSHRESKIIPKLFGGEEKV